jgi:two-component system, OmpR family, response regulator
MCGNVGGMGSENAAERWPELPWRVLLVEDDPILVDTLTTALKLFGFDVEVGEDARSAIETALRQVPHLVVLDVMLPDGDGFDLCRRLKRLSPSAPVLFLSGLTSLDDRMTGLHLGDDYLTKPFDVVELIARVKLLLRRAGRVSSSTRRLCVGQVELDLDTRVVTKDGTPVELTATEFEVLRILAVNAGRVVSRADVLEQVWRYDFQGRTGVVDTYVYYLRGKLGDHDHSLITTVRGAGYVLRRDDT